MNQPKPALNERDLRRYARHLTLDGFGPEAQRALRGSRALVIGAGGLGSPSLLYLAAAGIGHITVIDDDVVDESNLQRQIIHREADLGRPKAESARDAILRLDSQASVSAIVGRLTPENALTLFADHDVVLDGADNFATRYLSSDAAEITGTPLVWATIAQFTGQLSVFWPGRGPMLRDLFPEVPDPDSVPSCAAGGVLGAMVGQIGSMMAIEAIKVLTEVGQPAIGKLVMIDALGANTRALSFAADPDRRPVTDLEEIAAVCGPLFPGEIPQSVSSRMSDTGTQLEEDGSGMEEMTVYEAQERLQGEPKRTVLIDVREPAEYAEASIPGSILAPLSDIEVHGWEAVDKAVAAAGRDAGLDPAGVDTLIVHCRSGARSARAIEILQADPDFKQADPDFKRAAAGLRPAHLVNLAGGILAWQAGPGAQ